MSEYTRNYGNDHVTAMENHNEKEGSDKEQVTDICKGIDAVFMEEGAKLK